MSILEKAKPATSYRPQRGSYRIKALLLGASKGGKTTSACTVPGKKLLLDMDRRLASVVGKEDLDILEIGDPTNPRTWNEVVAAKNELWTAARAGNFPYSCVIFDGLTSMNRICMAYVLSLKRADGKPASMGFGGVGPAEHHYVPQMHLIIQFITSTLALPCHVIYTGHYDLFEEKGENESGIPMKTLHYWPKIYGKTRTEVATWFDESYECYVGRDRRGKPQYFWQTIGEGRKDFLGSSLNTEGKLWESPFPVNLDEKPSGFAKLLSLRFSNGNGSSNSNSNGKEKKNEKSNP